MDEHGLPIVGSGVDYTKVCIARAYATVIHCQVSTRMFRPAGGVVTNNCWPCQVLMLHCLKLWVQLQRCPTYTLDDAVLSQAQSSQAPEHL